jgi:lysozyme family protein
MIQKSLANLGFNIALDGIVGPQTKKALHEANAEAFCEQILQIREKFYYRIVERKPSQKVFLRGWLNRIKNLKKALADLPSED